MDYSIERVEITVAALIAQRDALLAEVAKYRGMEVENAGLRTDNEALRDQVAALKDECAEVWRVHANVVSALKATYEPPLTDEQAQRLTDDLGATPFHWKQRDAAIRAAREGR